MFSHSLLYVAVWQHANVLCPAPQAFMEDYEVAAFDMRGFGASEKPQACALSCQV